MKYLTVQSDTHYDALTRSYTLQQLQDFIDECREAGAPMDTQIRPDQGLVARFPLGEQL